MCMTSKVLHKCGHPGEGFFDSCGNIFGDNYWKDYSIIRTGVICSNCRDRGSEDLAEKIASEEYEARVKQRRNQHSSHTSPYGDGYSGSYGAGLGTSSLFHPSEAIEALNIQVSKSKYGCGDFGKDEMGGSKEEEKEDSNDGDSLEPDAGITSKSQSSRLSGVGSGSKGKEAGRGGKGDFHFHYHATPSTTATTTAQPQIPEILGLASLTARSVLDGARVGADAKVPAAVPGSYPARGSELSIVRAGKGKKGSKGV